MATLVPESYRFIQDWIRNNPATRDDFHGWGLSKQQYTALFQAIEDYMVGAFTTRPTTSLKAAIEAVTGPTTNARALSAVRAWNAWKTRNNLGGS